MTPLRWLIVVFWVFVAAMLVKQCVDFDASHNQAKAPEELHYYFNPSTQPAQTPPNPNADVRQVSFLIYEDQPAPGNFTCEVTVKNFGSKTAHNIQMTVRPFLGGQKGDLSHLSGVISEQDSLGQVSAPLAFPDLAPGEQKTETVSFLDQLNIIPGHNPHPDITFKTAP